MSHMRNQARLDELGIPVASGRGAVNSSFEFNVHELDSPEYLEAMTLSMKHKISVYDASYHVLASRLGCRFLTADRKFWEKVKGMGVAELL